MLTNLLYSRQSSAQQQLLHHVLQVRCGVLDKEVAELRDEVSSLQTRLAAFDEQAVRDFATKASRKAETILAAA